MSLDRSSMIHSATGFAPCGSTQSTRVQLGIGLKPHQAQVPPLCWPGSFSPIQGRPSVAKLGRNLFEADFALGWLLARLEQPRAQDPDKMGPPSYPDLGLGVSLV